MRDYNVAKLGSIVIVSHKAYLYYIILLGGGNTIMEEGGREWNIFENDMVAFSVVTEL